MPTQLTDEDIRGEWLQSTPNASTDDDATDEADDDATDDAADEADGADDDATDS